MIAYNTTWLRNLGIVKEVKQWSKQNIVTIDQYNTIKAEHPSSFYHPNLIIRILLFIATLIAASGVTGMFALMFADAFDNAWEGLALFYGIASWAFLELVFIKSKNHYKSGVNEALLYHSAGFTILGLAGMSNFNEHAVIIIFLMVSTIAAIRYADLISTLCSTGSLAAFVFMEMYNAGDIGKNIIPFGFIVIFGILFYFFRKIKPEKWSAPWLDCIILAEVLCLLLVYAAGNYLVVRELSVDMMDLYLEEGQDIPFAFIFYGLTVLIPIGYLFFGIRNKDVILLRVSLIVLAFSVFTFKYYFSLGHPEITLTLAGIVLIGIAMSLFRYLRTPKNGFTRENLLTEKWAASNPEAFIISQTLGGNKPITQDTPDVGSGGYSSGGGSADTW